MQRVHMSACTGPEPGSILGPSLGPIQAWHLTANAFGAVPFRFTDTPQSCVSLNVPVMIQTKAGAQDAGKCGKGQRWREQGQI